MSYDIDSPPAVPAQNRLDLYTPAGARRGSRPVVVWVHGGGWQQGDKRNQILRKAGLFTGAGYVFASVNYRLSGWRRPPARSTPTASSSPTIRTTWARRSGGSIATWPATAGTRRASCSSAIPRARIWPRSWESTRATCGPTGCRSSQILGVVSLDTAAYDIIGLADPRRNEGARGVWSVFGTPEENAATGSWVAASPLRWAEASDPPFLLVIQQTAKRARRNQTRRMARALGLASDAVLPSR